MSADSDKDNRVVEKEKNCQIQMEGVWSECIYDQAHNFKFFKKA